MEAPSSKAPAEKTTAEAPPYRAGERSWLKKHYGSEYYFLRDHGLSIYKEEHREEGRRILRAIRTQLQAQREEEQRARKDERPPPPPPPAQRDERPRAENVGDEEAQKTKRDENPRNNSTAGVTPTGAPDRASDEEESPTDDTILGFQNLECHSLPTGDAFNVDWVFSTGSGVHIANHRSWFKTYTPFKATTEENLAIVGVGAVELPIVTNKGFAILTLRNVLYAPTAVCNILGYSLLQQYGFSLDFRGTSKIYLDITRKTWAILDSPQLMKLRLIGQSPEQTSLDPNTMYMIRANLSDEDLLRMMVAIGAYDKTRAIRNLVHEFQEVL